MTINSQNDFQSVIDRLVKDENVSKTKREQGTLFERLVAQILRTQTHFKDEFKEVYLWNEFNANFNINSQDIGVDIMARTQNCISNSVDISPTAQYDNAGFCFEFSPCANALCSK